MTDSAYRLALNNKYLELQQKSLKRKIYLFKILKLKDSVIARYDQLMPLHDSMFNEKKLISSISAERQFKASQAIENLMLAEQRHKKTKKRDDVIISILGSVALLFLVGGYIINRTRKKVHKKQVSKLKVELLNKTIDPHFINGVLSSIAPEIQLKAPTSYTLLEKLSLLTRSVLAKDSILTTLEEQIAQAEGYLSILEFKYPERFTYKIECNVDNMKFELPKLIIHNLLENSYKHTLLAYAGNADISVYVKQDESYHTITVEDNGLGLQSEVQSGTKQG